MPRFHLANELARYATRLREADRRWHSLSDEGLPGSARSAGSAPTAPVAAAARPSAPATGRPGRLSPVGIGAADPARAHRLGDARRPPPRDP